MDVRLPDGTILKNVPDGTSKADLMAKLAANGYDVSKLDAPPQQAEPEANAAPPGRSALDEAGRVVGRTARAGLTGIAGIPLVVGDALNAGINKVLPEKYQLDPASKAFQDTLTSIGIAKPENASERISDDMAAAVTGVGGMAKLGQHVPKLSAFANNLRPQVAAAMSGAYASGQTREAGGGPWAQIAAGLLGGFAPSAATGLLRPVRLNLTQPARDMSKGNALNKVAMEGRTGPGAEAARNSILEKLDAARSQLPGEPTTTAKAAVGARQPAFTAMADEIPKGHAAARAEQLSADAMAARDNLLSTIAGTPEKLKRANDFQRAVSDRAYKRADTAPIKLADLKREADAIAEIMKRPPVAEAGTKVTKLAKSGSPVDEGFIADLQSRKRLIAEKLADVELKDSKTGVKSIEAKKLSETLAELSALIARISPAAKKADAIHARLKREPNRMRLGQKLETVLKSPLTGQDRAASFAKTLDDLDAAAIDSTGFPTNLRPDQRNALGNIRASLAREADVESQAAKGSKNMNTLMEGELTPPVAPNVLNRTMTILRGVMEHIGFATKATTLRELAEEMKDPAKIAALMRAAPVGWRARIRTLLRDAEQGTRNALPGSAQAQVQNALQDQ